MRRVCGTICGVAALALMSGAAISEEITLGIGTEPSSIDPNFYNFPQNHAIGDHWAETLVLKDNKQRAKPLLATSWNPLPNDNKVWEFKLRKGVKFTDGSPFTADDVLATHKYALGVKTGSPPGRYQRNKTLTKIDDYTVHITTGSAYPLMDKEMAMVHIVQKDMAATKETGDYNAGTANVGTGPYKFVEWVQGERVVFEPNPNYWGKKAKWSKVLFRPIKSDPARLAALLSGAVDIIDYVPTNDLDDLRKNPKLALTEYPSNRVIYFWPDQSRYDSPFVKTNDGKPAVPNPLRNIKVREAISLAINRKAIVERVMSGAGIEAEQMSPDFIFGSNPALPKLKYDPEQAKKLLAEAGWPDGFQMTIHGPNDRYVNDEKVSETVAQMLTKIGIKSKVVVMPKATYFGKTRAGDNPLGLPDIPQFSFFMMGSGSNLGDGGSQLQFSHHAYYPLKNMGVGNRGRYNNMNVDALMFAQMSETNVEKRRKQIQDGVAIVMRDWGFIPTHYQKNIWAHRKDLTYAGHTNEKTKAMLVSKK